MIDMIVRYLVENFCFPFQTLFVDKDLRIKCRIKPTFYLFLIIPYYPAKNPSFLFPSARLYLHIIALKGLQLWYINKNKIFLPTVMVDLSCQLDWATESLDIWLNIICGLSVRMLMGDIMGEIE